MVYEYGFAEDPSYGCEAATFLRETVKGLTGHEVIPVGDLGEKLVEICSSRDGRRGQIKVAVGQTFRMFHHLIGRSTLFIMGGTDWAPEYRAHPRLHVVPAIPDLTQLKHPGLN